MTRLHKLAGTVAALLLAACAAEPLPSGRFPSNPERAPGDVATLIDTVPTGQRCIVSGGAAQQLAVTTPRLVALSRFGESPIVDCFAEGHFRTRKAVPALAESAFSVRLATPGAIDTAFGLYPSLSRPGPGSLYPQRVRIRLQQQRFDSIPERDSYYATEAAWIREAWRRIEERLGQECGGQTNPEAKGLILLSEECRRALRILGERRAADLSAAEVNRRQSTIR